MQQSTTDRAEERSGLIAGFAAFITWGLVPVYWKLLKAVPAQEILAHRFVWTSIFLILLISWQRRWSEVRESARSARAMLYCLTSGTAIAINWFFFIWAVNAGHIIETSLGYFMTPLVNVLFGAVVFARTAHAAAADLGLARDRGGLESHLRLRTLPVDRAGSLFQFRRLRSASKKIRHARHSGIVF